MKVLFKTIAAGTGATLLIDCLTFILSLCSIKSRGLFFVGRWLTCIPQGKFFYVIIQTPAITNTGLTIAMGTATGMTVSKKLIFEDF